MTDELPPRNPRPRRKRNQGGPSPAEEAATREQTKLNLWAQREILKRYFKVLDRDPQQVLFIGRQLLSSIIGSKLDLDKSVLWDALQNDRDFAAAYRDVLLRKETAEAEATITELKRKARGPGYEDERRMNRELGYELVLDQLQQSRTRSDWEAAAKMVSAILEPFQPIIIAAVVAQAGGQPLPLPSLAGSPCGDAAGRMPLDAAVDSATPAGGAGDAAPTVA